MSTSRNGRHTQTKDPASPGGTRSSLRRWRSPAVVVGATAVVLGGLLLSNDGYDYDAVCVDGSGTRVPDDRCPDDDGGEGQGLTGDTSEGGSSGGSGGGGFAHWYYVRAGDRAPAVGERATGGTSLRPSGERFSVHTGGVDARGGTVTRGGFGGRLSSVGG